MGRAVLLLREESQPFISVDRVGLFTKERVEIPSGDFPHTATVNQGAEEETGSVGKDD